MALPSVDVRVLIEGELALRRGRIAITQRTVEEFLHVTTDPRRFDRPLTMKAALAFVSSVLRTRDVTGVVPAKTVLTRTMDLLLTHGLGRKRIQDTSLAAMLESANVSRLATFDGKDFAVFDFITVIDPRRK
jgi:predicted nucleic acid-binding protein